jgi:O-antigen/teichoic acid export membrane protein
MAAPPEPSDYAPTSLPSTGARALAFTAILVGGLCGGLIGYGFTDLQCGRDCSGLAAGAGVLGAVFGAVGVAVVAILALRAMGEWKVRQPPPEDREAG